MSEPLQFDYHPDADQICAFAEHALPPHEREQMLDHLAVCAECRTIVALSLPPIEQPAKTPAFSRLKPWWLGWRLGLPAGVSVAALVLSVFYIHQAAVVQQTPAPAQIAEGRVTAPQAPTPQSSTPTANQALQSAPNQSAAAHRQTPDIATNVESLPKAETAAKSDQKSGPQTQSRNSTALAKLAQPAPAAIPGQIAGIATSPRGSMGASEVNAPSSAAGALPKTTPPVQQAAKPVASSASSTESGGNALAGRDTETVAVESANRAIQTESLNSPLSINEEPVTPFILLKHPLPSGLPALSAAIQARRIVAIDERNGIFVSEDAGKHWKTIHPQWQGRAVRVERVGFAPASTSGLNLDRAPQQSALKAVRAAPAPEAAPPQIAADRPRAAGSGTSLAGTVTDATGAVVQGTSVSVIESATHSVHTVVTDQAGHYLVEGLTPGAYTVEARARGFANQRLTNVTVAQNHQNVANLSLQIGADTQAVTVSSDYARLADETAAESTPAKAKKHAAVDDSPVPAPVFAVVTDNGERWSSTDGVTWTRQ